MEQIKIQKNIPIPTDVKNKRFPFDEMAVNDSFLYSEKSNTNMVRNACTLCKSYVKRNELDFIFTVRKTDEGVRIWRVK